MIAVICNDTVTQALHLRDGIGLRAYGNCRQNAADQRRHAQQYREELISYHDPQDQVADVACLGGRGRGAVLSGGILGSRILGGLVTGSCRLGRGDRGIIHILYIRDDGRSLGSDSLIGSRLTLADRLQKTDRGDNSHILDLGADHPLIAVGITVAVVEAGFALRVGDNFVLLPVEGNLRAGNRLGIGLALRVEAGLHHRQLDGDRRALIFDILRLKIGIYVAEILCIGIDERDDIIICLDGIGHAPRKGVVD